MDPISIAALGSSIAQPVLNYFGQSSANKNYLKGIRETNATNILLNREQNAQNLAFWQMNNKYNDPASQRSRLIRAGINPSSVGSSVSSSPAAGTSPAVVNASGQMQSPISSLSQSLGGSLGSFIQNRYMDEQTKGLRYENQIKGISAEFAYRQKMQDLQEQVARIQGSNMDNRRKGEELEFVRSSLEHTKRMQEFAEGTAELEQDNLRAQAFNTQLLNVHQRLMNEAFPQRLANELHIGESQAYNLVNSVAAQYAAVNASILNNLRSTNVDYARLRQDLSMFNRTLNLRGQQLGLSERQVNLAERQFKMSWIDGLMSIPNRVQQNFGFSFSRLFNFLK